MPDAETRGRLVDKMPDWKTISLIVTLLAGGTGTVTGRVDAREQESVRALNAKAYQHAIEQLAEEREEHDATNAERKRAQADLMQCLSRGRSSSG
jgi:hypothetical protein